MAITRAKITYVIMVFVDDIYLPALGKNIEIQRREKHGKYQATVVDWSGGLHVSGINLKPEKWHGTKYNGNVQETNTIL